MAGEAPPSPREPRSEQNHPAGCCPCRMLLPQTVLRSKLGALIPAATGPTSGAQQRVEGRAIPCLPGEPLRPGRALTVLDTAEEEEGVPSSGCNEP